MRMVIAKPSRSDFSKLDIMSVSRKISDLPLANVGYVVNENSSHRATIKEAGHEE